MSSTRREFLAHTSRGFALSLASATPCALTAGGLGLTGCAHRTRETDPAAPNPSVAIEPYAQLRGFCDGIPEVTADEFAERRERGRRALFDEGYDALIVEAGRHLNFFTGTRWGQSERALLWVLPREGSPMWIAPAFEENTLMGRLAPPRTVDLRTWREDESPYDVLENGLRARGMQGAKVALDPDMRAFVADGIQHRLTDAKVARPVFEAARVVKTTTELARLRRANEATKAALRLAAGDLRPGMTEPEFAALVRSAQLAAGLEDIWVLALFGPNAAYPHGTERRRTMCPSQMVLVDTGGSLHGYQSDITRTWAPGPIDAEQRRAFDTVLAAQTEAMEMIRPGVRCGEVDARAREVMAAAGYGPHYQRFTHRLGHGIGIQGHEAPYLVRNNPRLLAPGMTMSNEPGIYVPGKFGVRIEDIVAVTETGYEVFGPRVRSFDEPFGIS